VSDDDEFLQRMQLTTHALKDLGPEDQGRQSHLIPRRVWQVMYRKEVRIFTVGDEMKLTGLQAGTPPAAIAQQREDRVFQGLASFIDLILPSDRAEGVIGDLAEGYARRMARSPRHARRWLGFQVAWIVYGRAMDLFRLFNRARAGK
jgi:hypothetical protein